MLSPKAFSKALAAFSLLISTDINGAVTNIDDLVIQATHMIN